jgi:hypothetical protein
MINKFTIMKLKIISFCLVLVSIFASCKKEPLDTGTAASSGLFLLSKVTTDNQSSDEYVYNSVNLISEEKSKFDYALHHYNASNQLVSTDFYGNDDILSSNLQVFTTAINRTEWVTPLNGVKGGTLTYEYNGSGQLVKTTYTRPSSTCSEYSLFSYDNNNRINKQMMYWENNETGYIDYSYDEKGNLITESLYNIPSPGTAELITTTQYVYDNQQNPFKSFKQLMLPGINTNVNNISKETYTLNSKNDQASDKIQITQNTYQYNASGFPVSKNGNVKYIYK